jgi:hypothetical protein
VCRLHERQSADLADFPLPTGRQEEWRFTPLQPQGCGGWPDSFHAAKRELCLSGLIG